MNVRKLWYLAPLAALLATQAHAESSPAFNNVDLNAAPCCSSLSLKDTKGVRRTLSDFKGKVVVVAFGFTSCPDVCPTTLHELSQSMELLKERGREVQVLFVTLDPARDTAEKLGAYVAAFHPTFIGLRGSAEEVKATTRDFRVFFELVPGKTAQSYTIDHTVGVYLIDKSGKARVYARSADPKILLPDIQRLLGKSAV